MAALPAYAPMMAQPGRLPEPGGDYAYEMKWDGVRALGYVEDGTLRLVSRNGRDITAAYPELAGLAGATGGHAAVLDGEIVAFDRRGRPSFEALQPRMHQRNPLKIRQLVVTTPVTYLLFDVLHVDADSVITMPYTERRRRLEDLVHPGPRWAVPPCYTGGGEHALADSRRLGLEGVVAKRLASPYRPGRRSPDWVKVKNVRTQEVVVGGWRAGEGRRANTVGSLLVGVNDGSGRLRYAGSVGTGFTDEALRRLGERLAPLRRDTPPFEGITREEAKGCRWVEPVLVGEVQFAEWTGEGRLRHPSWRGLRDDKDPAEVVREDG
ncbi:ATP-dependent DNA ligase [Microbispora rosea subsp. aerata]|nr:non-homologous end-joining DNA ligase [Microbispora rosea]GGO11333.1 ATP-dependent DNA ligase [Microbispora rosea subsp. aerata]GIH53536.1 ATP-dependent DNA ligase [Microbispora rosea subsp. aerata]GLJ86203.1 ATP-dependent DNA ligase [Microbispora rosea subsp. aerata]